MVKRHSTVPFEFVCITENPNDLDPAIKTYQCPDWGVAGERKGWWYKVMLFQPQFQEAMGDGVKRIIDDEVPISKKLRSHFFTR